MERHLKGMANHHRIEILLYVADHEGATLDDIIAGLKANPKTIGEHTRRLYLSGLINKNYKGKFVEAIPHVTDEIIRRIKLAGEVHKSDIVIV